MMNKTRRKKLDTVLTYVILILLASFIVVPVLWMLSTAFKTEAQTYYPNPKWLPDPFSLESFHKFFSTYSFGKMTVNSLITCLAAMVICVACACLAGYGITRFKFKGRKQLLNFLLITQMFPSVMLVVPFYAVLSKYHLTNTLLGLIVVYAATNVAFSTWMLVSYFKTVPIELDEAARVDGAGYFQCALHVTLPAMMETFVVLFILNIGNFLNTGYEQYLLFKNSLTATNIEVLDLYTYRIGLQNMDYSYGVAISVVKSLVSITLVVVANLVAKKIRGRAVI